eukprot:CAMPEP_0177498460 /NCGR_PEP_ID=MMETSP0369-20130122/35593_1 /TAXON_ID=447022 ORGANISM="Scrippsiella hangoei-like, Strain SHHI-4" /NCGR_SAMPLE_ID=MMETSP0369 /ASSEMBLY_ACC=CAM_ASM_000364 /LENGTH=190 /DNA_ID=CAMNT_0018975681 /DNA_START=113 /DNA_END=685 /DNA_ORIENTATION=-
MQAQTFYTGPPSIRIQSTCCDPVAARARASRPLPANTSHEEDCMAMVAVVGLQPTRPTLSHSKSSGHHEHGPPPLEVGLDARARASRPLPWSNSLRVLVQNHPRCGYKGLRRMHHLSHAMCRLIRELQAALLQGASHRVLGEHWLLCNHRELHHLATRQHLQPGCHLKGPLHQQRRISGAGAKNRRQHDK